MGKDLSNYLSRTQFAAELGVHERDVFGAIQLGLIPAEKLGGRLLINRKLLAKCKPRYSVKR